MYCIESVLCVHLTLNFGPNEVDTGSFACCCMFYTRSISPKPVDTDALLGMSINDREIPCYILNRDQTVKRTSSTTVIFKLKLFNSLFVLFFFLWLTVHVLAGCFNFAVCKPNKLAFLDSVRLKFVPC